MTDYYTPPGNNSMKHYLITGASGGLGSALARRAAAPGHRLSLWGRNLDRLAATKEQCEQQGASVSLASLDLREHAQCRDRLRVLFADRPVDMAILNAGVSSGMSPEGGIEPAEDACRTMDVNSTAAINMAATLLECMLTRGSGHIVFISSIAGLYPLPGSPAYSAAKAALAYYAKGLRLRCRNTPVRISIVYPGYIETPMSRRLLGPQPMKVTAETAAATIMDSLAAGKNCVTFPLLLALGARFLHFMPMPLAAFFLKRFSFTVAPDGESPLAETPPKNGDASGA